MILPFRNKISETDYLFCRWNVQKLLLGFKNFLRSNLIKLFSHQICAMHHIISEIQYEILRACMLSRSHVFNIMQVNPSHLSNIETWQLFFFWTWYIYSAFKNVKSLTILIFRMRTKRPLSAALQVQRSAVRLPVPAARLAVRLDLLPPVTARLG